MLSGTAVGNLGGDATQKQVGNGTVVEFSIASTKKIKGEKHTTWLRCQYWNEKAALAVLPYLKKGGTVAVSGDIELREFTKNGGEKGSSLEMRVNSLQLCGGKSDGGSGGGGGGAPDDDSIPF